MPHYQEHFPEDSKPSEERQEKTTSESQPPSSSSSSAAAAAAAAAAPAAAAGTKVAGVDLEEAQELVCEIIKRAGDVVVSAAARRENRSSRKKDSSGVDLVTDTDIEVEALIFDGIRKKYPHHCFIGEETDGEKIEGITEEPTWIVDPIDGTMNFTHGNENVAISVGMGLGRRAALAVVLLPFKGKLYTAIRGKGAFCNGKPIKVSDCTDVKKALVLVESYCRRGEAEKRHQENRWALLDNVQAIRQLGSTVLDLTMVASGQADAYAHAGVHCWDFAAGALLVREAGGVVLDPSGEDFDLMSGRILVASSREVAEGIIGLGVRFAQCKRDADDVVHY